MQALNRRDINKQTIPKRFFALNRRSVSPLCPANGACVRALRGQRDRTGSVATSLATQSTGTVLIPRQTSQIAGHDEIDQLHCIRAAPAVWCDQLRQGIYLHQRIGLETVLMETRHGQQRVSSVWVLERYRYFLLLRHSLHRDRLGQHRPRSAGSSGRMKRIDFDC